MTTLPYTAEHEEFRKRYAEFLEREAVPNIAKWTEQRIVPHEFYEKAGAEGFLCTWAPEEFGGQAKDFLYDVIVVEENTRHGFTGANWLHSSVTTPYIAHYATPELKAELMPKFITGEKLVCVSMTEPEHGSDLASIETTAVRDGDEYVINGDKCFITNGMVSDYVICAAITNPGTEQAGFSLILVPTDAPGFSREKMRKIGSHLQDTSELHYRNVRVPVTNLLGEEGKGFKYCMMKLNQERLIASVLAQESAEWALREGCSYAKERNVKPTKKLIQTQYTQFELAKLAIEVEASRTLLESTVIQHMAGGDMTKQVAMTKYLTTETAHKTADKVTQLWGGHGVCYEESAIGDLYVNTKIQCISAGTSEVMLMLVSRYL